MRSYRHLIVITLFVLTSGLPAAAQSPPANPDQSELFRQLLAMPAPPPSTPTKYQQSLIERPEEFFLRDRVPADDAPLEDLQMYWSRWAALGDDHRPSEAVQQRLLDACANDREALPGYLLLLAATETTTKKVKQIFDQGQADQPEDWRNEVRNWLLMNSRYFLGELTARASKAKDVEKEGMVKAEDAVIALARVDWSTAEPFLKRLESSGQPRTSALATALIYRHAIDEKDPGLEESYRGRLKAIAGDRNAAIRARDISIEALSTSEWSGRDDWYLSLFRDETLIDPDDGANNVTPLATLAANDPEKWIPQLVKLVESKDLIARSAAASLLVDFDGPEQLTALKPLLPWLSDSTWAKDLRDHRGRLIQHLGLADLPESVPGLISVLENDAESERHRAYAGEALAKYKDPRAVPAIKKALIAEKSQYNRQRLLVGLIASGGLPESEQLEALEAVAQRLMTTESRWELFRYGEEAGPLPLPLSIGMYLSRGQDISESLLKAVVNRAEDLKKSNPALGASLLEIVHQWDGTLVDLDMIHRTAIGTADANTIVKLLKKSQQLREKLSADLQALTSLDGTAAQGIGAVLLEDSDLAVSLLGSGKEPAQTALLLCARLTRQSLPASAVIPLLNSENKMLVLAAERYLLVEDSPEAREALWAKHPNETFITGWRDKIDYLGPKSDTADKIEEKLRGEFGEADSPLATYALVGFNEDYLATLRVYPDRALYSRSNDSSRYSERVITKEELASFQDFVRKEGIAELGPQFNPCHRDCMSSELLVLSREKGRRVLNVGTFSLWADLRKHFNDLERGENLKTHYNFEDAIKGLEVLYRDDQLIVKDVWQKGADVRILVRREDTEAEVKQPRTADDDDDDNERVAESLRKEHNLESARYSWRTLRNGRATELSPKPDGFSTIDENRFPLIDEELRANVAERTGQFIAEDTIVFDVRTEGLWRQSAGQKAVRISSEPGWYSDSIATPDGKWVVVGRRDEGWGPPLFVARFNLQTGREVRVKLPAADQIKPIAYLASQGKVLVRRDSFGGRYSVNKSNGESGTEFYLLDAATGETRLVSGEFEPLQPQGKRFLQSTGKPNEFWAAIPDRKKDQTRVGRYNLKDFTFQQVLLVPRISFNSMSMWVDEAAGKLYFVYKGDLLRLPLLSSP